MAHALRRISYATCDPEHCQFSFLAREPKGHFSLQYCHSFLTQSSEQAEELNTIVGNAFRMAYAAQLQKNHQSRYNDLLVSDHHRAGLYEGVTDSPLSTPPSSCDNSPLHRPLSTGISPLASETRCSSNGNIRHSSPRHSVVYTENRKDRYAGYNRLWAKQVLGKSQHKEPVLERVVEMNVLSGLTGSPCRRHLDQANGNIANVSPSRIPLNSHPVKPHSIPGLENVRNTEDILTPSSTSSDDANSPTELNSYKRLVDKPPLIKRLTMAIDSYEEELCPLVKDMSGNRPLSGGYVNEGMGSSTDNIIEEIPVKDTGFSYSSSSSPTQVVSSLKKLNGLKTRPLPSPPFSDSFMDQSSDGSKRSSRSSESQGSLLQESLTIQEHRDTAALVRNDSRVIQDNHGSPSLLKNDPKIKRISQISGSSCSSSSSPPPPPERYDSLQSNDTEEGELRKAPWFQAGIPREIALEILGQEPVGAFMVRESTTKPGCYALSLRVPKEFQPTGIAHYLIMKTNKGYKIKGFTKEFCTLTALITHHSVMPELLPCPLSLARYNPNFSKHDSNQDFADIDDDPDYNTLSDFRKMMADLNV